MKFTFPPESKPLAGYTIKRGIHRGAFGEVYYAHTEAGKEVALKLLQSQMEVELRGVRQCLNLKHANLVSLYDIRVDDDGDHWIVMEYVAGQSLAEVLDDHPDGLPLDEVSRWIEGMAAGLDFLHDRGIVHRDLKPANVFIEDGVVKIGDVGLSKYISQSRRNEQTQSVGTVYYMAPEVAHGRYGQEVDVYSLGIVLYELLTGRVPFDGESTGEILMKHLTEKPDLTLVDEAYRPVLAKALAKDPTQRTHTAGEVARSFTAVTNRAGSRRLVGVGVGSDDPPVEQSLPWGGTHVDEGSLDNSERERLERERRRDERSKAKWNALVYGFDPRDWFSDSECTRTDGDCRNRFLRAWHGPNKMWVRWGTAAAVVALFASGAGFVLLGIAAVVVLVKYGIEAIVDLFSEPSPTPTQAPTKPSRREEPLEDEPIVEIVSVPRVTPRPVEFDRTTEVRRAKRGELLTPDTPRSLPMRERIAELAGALAYAGPLTALVTAGLLLAMPLLRFGGGVSAEPGTIGLFAGVTVLGSWAILFAAKVVEGRELKGLHRRIAYFVVGALVGLAAFWLHRNFFVVLSDGVFADGRTWVLGPPGRSLFRDGVVDVQKYMLFFGLLFAARRWWWHVDGYRSDRFHVWTVVVTGLVAWLLSAILAFPALWAVLWAVTICCVVQLSAAWLPPDSRLVRTGRTRS